MIPSWLGQYAPLLVIALVALLAIPYVYTHRVIVPIVYRTGQLLLLLVIIAGVAAFLWPAQANAVARWMAEISGTTPPTFGGLSLASVLALTSVVLLFLQSIYSSCFEAVKAAKKPQHQQRDSDRNARNHSRDEVQTLLRRARRNR